MNNRKLNKQLKRMFKSIEKEKKLCAELYPDWRDNEFNMLHNQFIWGFSTSTTETSFSTVNEVQVYYNRANNKYFLDIDLSNCIDMDDKCYVLERALNEFIIDYDGYVEDITIHEYTDLTDTTFSNFDFYCCKDIAEVYFKLRLLCAGLNDYWRIGDKLSELDK